MQCSLATAIFPKRFAEELTNIQNMRDLTQLHFLHLSKFLKKWLLAYV